MKTLLVLLLAVICMLSFSVSAFADPVDLTGKKGVVDPKDLKKDNPKHEKLQKTVPPPPGSGSSDNKRPFGQGSYGVAK